MCFIFRGGHLFDRLDPIVASQPFHTVTSGLSVSATGGTVPDNTKEETAITLNPVCHEKTLTVGRGGRSHCVPWQPPRLSLAFFGSYSSGLSP